MKWKTWIKGLAAVAIGGAATGAAQAVAGGLVNQATALTAGIGALSTVLAYLCRSPLAGFPQAEPQPPASDDAAAGSAPVRQ